MADISDSRESDNNSWVIAGSEALPVEEISAEAVEETVEEAEPAKDGTHAPPSDSKLPTDHPEPEGAKLKDLGGVPAPSSGPAKTPEPIHLEREPPTLPLKEPSLQDVKASSAPSTEDTLIVHKAGAGPLEQHVSTSSSDEEGAVEQDVEGLRRRKGRDAPAAPPGSSQDGDREAPENEGGGLSGTKWLLGLLALLGLGFLAFSGVIFDLEEGPVDTLGTRGSSEGEDLHPGTDGKQGWPASPPPEARRGARPPRAKGEPLSEAPTQPQSLDAMGLLLDKLAKENQEIRLMQAELQSQKEELQGLLQKTEGEALEFTSQQQNLAAENSRLRESLQRETSTLLAAQAELRFLQDKLRRAEGEADGAGPQRHGGEEAAAERQRDQAERPEPEIRRLRSLLELVRHDLAKALLITPSSEGAEGLRMELSAIQQKLSQETERPRGSKPPWREAHKSKRGKERAWLKRHEGQEGHRELNSAKDHRLAHKSSKAADDGPHHPRKHQGPREAKSAKENLSRKAKKPSEPSALWEMLTRHRFQAPQGCTGIAECARQEGLAPVHKTGFLQMVQNYLARLGWAEHYGGLAAALENFFGSDGDFAHNRTSFVDFLDEIEDVLEDLAQLLGGSEEAVDDFEEVVLRQLGAAPGGRFSQRNPKERPREGHGRRNGKEGNHRSHG